MPDLDHGYGCTACSGSGGHGDIRESYRVAELVIHTEKCQIKVSQQVEDLFRVSSSVADNNLALLRIESPEAVLAAPIAVGGGDDGVTWRKAKCMANCYVVRIGIVSELAHNDRVSHSILQSRCATYASVSVNIQNCKPEWRFRVTVII